MEKSFAKAVPTRKIDLTENFRFPNNFFREINNFSGLCPEILRVYRQKVRI
jgi:hypothetical protein